MNNIHLRPVINLELFRGSGCSTAVEDTPCDSEVMGSDPVGCSAFFLFVLKKAHLYTCNVKSYQKLRNKKYWPSQNGLN